MDRFLIWRGEEMTIWYWLLWLLLGLMLILYFNLESEDRFNKHTIYMHVIETNNLLTYYRKGER